MSDHSTSTPVWEPTLKDIIRNFKAVNFSCKEDFPTSLVWYTVLLILSLVSIKFIVKVMINLNSIYIASVQKQHCVTKIDKQESRQTDTQQIAQMNESNQQVLCFYYRNLPTLLTLNCFPYYITLSVKTWYTKETNCYISIVLAMPAFGWLGRFIAG